MRLGRLISIGRAADNMSAPELADALGIPTRTLTNIERGGRCDAATLVKLLTWLTEEPKPSTEPEGRP